MATTTEYLEQLQKDRDDLADTLVANGVSAFKTETFTSLIPKINKVKSKLQEKTASPAEKGAEVLPDEGYDAMSKVNISPITASMIRGLTPNNVKKNVEILDIVGTYGSSAQAKTVNPTIHGVTVYPDVEAEYLSQVVVNPVTASIDANITASNIRKGISILGVEGTFDGDFYFQKKTVQPSANSDITVEPDDTYDALEQVIIKKVTANIDADIQPGNIRNGVNILGVVGTYAPEPSMTNKTIYPTTSRQVVLPDEGYGYFDKVTVEGVSSSIDGNIKSDNIKKGVSILGVAGTVEPVDSEDLVLEPSVEEKVYTPSKNKNAINQVTVLPVTAAIDEKIAGTNIKKGVKILGVEGTYEGVSSLQTKTVIPTTETQEITADEGYDALSNVTVEAIQTEDLYVEPSTSSKIYTREEGKYINSVEVGQVTSDIDANIQPENIKQNMSILGVVGTYKGEQKTYFKTISTGSTSIPGVLDAITAIPDDTIITSGAYAFYNCRGLLQAPAIDYTDLGERLDYMFQNCTAMTDASAVRGIVDVDYAVHMFQNSGLVSLNLTGWKSISLSSNDSADLRHWCNSCKQLKTVNITNFEGSFSPEYAFQNCTALTHFSWKDSNCSVGQKNSTGCFDAMFNGCSNLLEIDLSGFTGSVGSMGDEFINGCSKLRKIDFRNADLSKSSNWGETLWGKPSDLLIIVKDEASKQAIIGYQTHHTNVKTVAEYEGASA